MLFWFELIVYMVEYNILKDEVMDGKLICGVGIELWVEDYGFIVNIVFGYGVGVMCVDLCNNLVIKLGIKDFWSYGVGNLVVMVVLWELGVIGFLILNVIFVVVFIYVGWLEYRFFYDSWLLGIFFGI